MMAPGGEAPRRIPALPPRLVRPWLPARRGGGRPRATPLAVALILVVALFVCGGLLISGFTSHYSIVSMLILASFLGIAAAGQTLVVLLGGIDLSIPFVIGFADVVAAELNVRGFPFWATALIVLVAALTIGACNGAISARLGIHPLIVTLGVGYVVENGVEVWTGGITSGSAPDWLSRAVSPATTSGPIALPPIVLFWLLVSVVVVVLLRRTVFGRYLYAVGSSPRAAQLALVRPVVIWAATFALSALCAALAGILLLGFTGNELATVGDPYLFLSVGAVVIGGTSLLGGTGGYTGTVLGALILTELTTILVGLNFSQAVEQTLLGVIIILVVLLYGREAHIRTRI